MTPLLAALAFSSLAVFFFMNALFALAMSRRDNSIVDIAWGPGFLLIAVATFVAGSTFGLRALVVDLLVLVWAARLALHVSFRNRGRGEDPRYAAWRRAWGRRFVLRSWLQVFMLQGFFMLLVGCPIVIAGLSSTPDRFGALEAAGVAVWAVGFFFEALGDAQLLRFKRNPENKGRIMTSGLWAFTRHPNYFGEATMWWGLFLVVLGAPGGWTAVLSPLTITFLLLRVSGVTLLEKRYAGNPEFAAYARRTNAFFPWFPKKGRLSPEPGKEDDG
jgi:steroid 5-alpha reductase family enzyme